MGSDNVAGIQQQHKMLEEKINAVCTMLKNRGGMDESKDRLDDLVQFLQTHCKEEERLMKHYGYKGLAPHEREHGVLLDRIVSLRETMYTSSDDQSKQDLIDFLEIDFMGHVMEDMKAWEEGEMEREFVYRRLQNSANASTGS